VAVKEPDPGDPDLPWGATPPTPLGDAASFRTVGEVAAPLLAGFSIALVGVVAQNPESARWPGASLLLLVGAAMLLLATVQVGFRARQYYWTRADLLDWYEVAPGGELDRAFRDMHVRHLHRWKRAREVMRVTYNAGIATLTVAVGLVVSPPLRYGSEPLTPVEAGIRWAAFAVCLAAAAGELVWWLGPNRKDRPTRKDTG
jgi:hypothetical protein